MKKTYITIDGNEAVVRVAHKINEVIAPLYVEIFGFFGGKIR